MAVCQYAGETGCSAPVFGGGSNPANANATPHVNFFEHYIFGTSHLEWVINSIFILLVVRFIVWPFIIVPLLDWLDFRRQRNVKTVLLELTPPSVSTKPAEATKELFKVLHSLYSIKSYKDHLFRRKQLFSCEVVSTREEGIRFMARVPAGNVKSFRQAVASYMPDVQFKKIDDYLGEMPASDTRIELMDFKQLRPFAYPLRTQESLATHDPIAYLTGAIAKPEPGEFLAVQFAISSYNSNRAMKIRNKIMQGKNPWLLEFSSALPINLLLLIVKYLAYAFIFAYNLSVFVIGLFTGNPPTPASRESSAEPAMQEVRDKMVNKLAEPLFYVDVRAFVSVHDSQQAVVRQSGIISSLASFNDPGYQQLISGSKVLPPLVSRLLDTIVPKFVWQKYHNYKESKFKLRLPSMFNFNANILSASEIASLYHFPYGDKTTENTVKSFSKTLPAPISVKKHSDKADFDVVLGRNHHHGTETDIGLTMQERERHIYIIGGTGNGKTTMLQYAIVQDMQNGKGLAVVDPHGDMAETILKHVPENRTKDVVYFNPDDIGYPIGLNLLELPEGITGDELMREKDLITESVISVFRKIFSEEDTGGHRIEYVLRNTIQTALTVPGATLFTVFDLLNDPQYRKSVLKTLDNKDLINFWKNELGKAGEMQRVKMAAGITAKIGRFLFSASAKRILEQPKSTIDFDDIINSGKILVCNFSKGLLGEDTSELFGITVLAKLQLASLRRARLRQSERRPFFLYVDEFQNFATTSFVQMLSESRKYKLFMTMAEQSTSQQKDQKMVSVILANVGTVICFRTGNPEDERLLLPLFTPYVEEGEISNLSAFNFYARLSAMQAQEPVSGQTMLLDDEGDQKIASVVIALSRKNFALLKPTNTAITNPHKTNADKEQEMEMSPPEEDELPGLDEPT